MEDRQEKFSLSSSRQLNLDIRMQKIFDECKLDNNWKRKENSASFHEYTALEQGAAINLYLGKAKLKETFRFKKGSDIILHESIVKYHENDLLE